MLTNDLVNQMRVADTEPTIKPRYKILTAFDVLLPQPPIDWVVDGLISAGSLNIFFGEGGSKKTWALLDMGVCVAHGAKWLGMQSKPSNVLIIDEESGKRRISQRISKVLCGHGADDKTPIYCVSLAGFDFGEPNDIGELYNLIDSTKAGLVIIDALADVMPGKDENSVKDVQPIFLSLRKIAEETQAAIVIIHHSNKNGGYRGSTAIKGALDLLVNVESKTGNDEINFKTEKARDTAPRDFVAIAEFMDNAFKLKETEIMSFSGAFTKAERFVIDYLTEHGESSSLEITQSIDPQVDPAPKSVKNAISSLKSKGEIYRIDTGSTSIGTYKLSPQREKIAKG